MNVERLPRKDLREEAFRKYEQDIALGCKGSYVLDPRKFSRPMKAASYVARFTDAKRGYRVYGYQSELIPKNYDLDRVRAFELSDGTVQISNEIEDAISTGKKWNVQHAIVAPRPIVTNQENTAPRIIEWNNRPVRQLYARNQEEIETLVKNIASGVTDGFAFSYLVYCANDSEKDWLFNRVKELDPDAALQETGHAGVYWLS